MKTKTLPRTLPRTYAKLVDLHAPRVIHDRAEAGVVADLVGKLMLLPGRTPDQTDYYDLLIKLYADWERKHPRPKSTPAEMIRYMMEEHDMTQAAMAEVMGISPGGMSLILSGERAVSKASAKRFAARFAISAAALL